MADILYGKPVAESILGTVKRRSEELSRKGEIFTIASVRIGSNPDDAAYERSIARACEKCGITFSPAVLPIDSPTSDVICEIERINADDSIRGCIVFQPMPKHMDADAIRNTIASSKDIDCASDFSLGDVLLGCPQAFAPATAEAVIRLCDYYDIDLEGANVAVVGRSRVIGRPVGMLALDRHATVTFCHSRTCDLQNCTRGADIVICAVGRPRFFTKEYFKGGQCVIDVGMNIDDDGSLCGDVAFEDVSEVVSAITPVPGGIGAITTSVLLDHATRQA